MLFIGFLVETNKQSMTVKSYVSAIKSVLADEGITINENRYLVGSLTKACKLKNDVLQTRLPIHKGLLVMLITEIKNRYLDLGQVFLSILYSTFLLTTYFGFFRIGELASSPHAVCANDVQIGDNKRKMMFVLRSLKTHGKNTMPQLINISSSKSKDNKKKKCDKDSRLPCPYQSIRDYITIRGPFYSEADQFLISQMDHQ